MHIAPLIGCLRQNLAQRCPQAGMIVGHDEFDAVQTTRFQREQEIPPLDRLSRLASSTASTWRRPSQSMPIAISTA